MKWYFFYLGSSLGFAAASMLWVRETIEDDVERPYMMIAIVTLVSLIWPIMLLIFFSVKIWRRVTNQFLKSTLS